MERNWTDIDWQSLIEQSHLDVRDSRNVTMLQSWATSETNQQLPPVVSARFAQRRAKVSSYFFSETGALASSPTAANEKDSAKFSSQFQTDPLQKIEALDGAMESVEEPIGDPITLNTRTRPSPPQDVIRLGDRLFYMLQPPLESIFANKTMEFPFKPFEFQYAGIAFLFPRYSAILADEMGLGKTMQAITSMRMLIRSGKASNVLLICPKPLVTNWVREFKTWAPEISVGVIKGNQSERRWHWKHNPSLVKIANYELLIRDEETATNSDLNFDLVVLDEAQRIKNKSNSTSKVIQKINRKRSWAMTGTPIENSIEDLVGICEFVSPGAVSSGMTAKQVRTRVKDLIIRRTKDLVMKDMPPRLMRDAELDLSSEQFDTYQAAEKDGVIRLNEMGQEITIKHVFELVLRLKQICNFDPVTKSSSKIDRLQADLEEVAASGQKAIVFSQWVDSIKEVSGQIQKYNPLEYHGRIPSKQRDPILEEFKHNPDRHVLLMSYGAGSVGLNLQFCRYVFLFDRWWNPAVEDQAINRAHRIGAAGSVTVTRMIMAGTIEQRIHEILEAKRELFRAILSDDQQPAKRGLSKDEIFGLFNLTTPEGKISPTSNAA
jgi:SNF2 family DNA or RNA helicase